MRTGNLGPVCPTTFEVRSLPSKTTTVPVVPPTPDHLVALAPDATLAVEEAVLAEAEAAAADAAVPPNAEHIPMSPTGLLFRTTSDTSIGLSSLIILRRSLMTTRHCWRNHCQDSPPFCFTSRSTRRPRSPPQHPRKCCQAPKQDNAIGRYEEGHYESNCTVFEEKSS